MTDFCPSCKTSKYNNPQMRLMVNICGHSLCENCVEILFVRGSGLCFHCNISLRKVNFRYQIFEDPYVEKELEIRKKILSDFNKREEDFDCLEDYDLYLENIEDIIYKLTNDIDVDETKKIVEQYKKDNKDIIKKNRNKQPHCLEFYESELEREKSLHERCQKEDEDELRSRIQGTPSCQPRSIFSNSDQNTCSLNGNSRVTLVDHTSLSSTPASQTRLSLMPPLSPASNFSSRNKFLPPPSASVGTPLQRASQNLMPSAVWSLGSIPPSSSVQFAAPPSCSIPIICPPTGFIGSNTCSWATNSEHHNVIIPPVAARNSHNQLDEEVFKPRSLLSRKRAHAQLEGCDEAGSLEAYQPFCLELSGPEPPPRPNGLQLERLERIYNQTIVACAQREAPTEDGGQSAVEGDTSFTSNPEASERALGLSALLPSGASGISPTVFLTRCLQESRCGLYI